jgi:hypothetical protein
MTNDPMTNDLMTNIWSVSEGLRFICKEHNSC